MDERTKIMASEGGRKNTSRTKTMNIDSTNKSGTKKRISLFLNRDAKDRSLSGPNLIIYEYIFSKSKTLLGDLLIRPIIKWNILA